MKKSYYIALGIVAIFIITNPSASAFKEYIGASSYNGLKRTNQFYICSLYKARGGEYFGIFGNFIKVEPPKVSRQQISVSNQIYKDTLSMTGSTKCKWQNLKINKLLVIHQMGCLYLAKKNKIMEISELNESIKLLTGAIEDLTKVMDSVYNRQSELLDTWPYLSDEMSKISSRLEKLADKL